MHFCTNGIYKNYKKINESLQVRAHIGKSVLHSISGDNRGSMTVEATLVVPIFIFAFLAIFHMGRMFIAEEQIYVAMMETADYIAERAYPMDKIGIANTDKTGIGNMVIGNRMAKTKMKEYIGDTAYVEEYVEGGVDGISYIGSTYITDEDYIDIRLNYNMVIDAPLIKEFKVKLCSRVRQKAYTGYCYEDEKVEYVYVAENGEVYHRSRDCSHISLKVSNISKASLKGSYSHLVPCRLCGDEGNYNGEVYACEYGDAYHYSRGCSGLKRSISRVKLDDVRGMGECSRCGN